jgi:hypothetical protein
MHLPSGKVTWQNAGTTDYSIARTFFLTAGYFYDIEGDRNKELQPSIFIKKDLARTSYSGTVLFLYQQRFWGGLNARTEQLTALSAMLGMYIYNTAKTQVRLGYSYDIATSKPTAFGGTHEFMVGISHLLVLPPREEVKPFDVRHLGLP